MGSLRTQVFWAYAPLLSTSSLIAAFLDMRFKYSFPAIMVGNLIAGLIIMVLSSGVFTVLAR